MLSDKSEEDEHEAISKQIVEYYKQYSLSQHLPKYFSGSPLSYMPKIVKDEEVNKPVIIIEDTSSSKFVPKTSEYSQTDVEEAGEPKPVSPASSATSIRKLEWDSGADIGYNNANKSLKLHKSFSLPTLTATFESKIKGKLPKNKLSSHIVNVISYSSAEKTAQSSSSSSSYHADPPPMSSSSSSSSAKLPSAKPLSSSSSSNARVPSAKPLSSSSGSFANTLAFLKTKIGSPDAESTPKGVTNYKTIDTEFIPRSYKKFPNKTIELCVTKPISIECLDGKKKKALDKRVQTSFVEKLSKSVQTGDDTVDGKKALKPKENQSIIIINYGDVSDKKTATSNTQTDSEILPSPVDDQKNNLRRAEAQSNLATSTDSSKGIPPLSQLISRKQSKTLTTDIDRSIELLHKLLKSKRYDSATKKRYIKKIVEKIVDNKYNDDSTSSSSLFKPKKQDPQQKLQENIPWYPPKLSKFGVKTFNEEFLPKQAKKKSMFTLSEAHTPTSCMETYSSLEKQENTTSGSFQSWKEDKTMSERLFEEKQKGGGDQLVNFARKERQNQLCWINDEIAHLVKLKELLEQTQAHTTTTVYMLSQQYNKKDSSSERGRNYVIQTELSGSGTISPEGVTQRLDSGKGSPSLAGNIHVVSDERTTSIKVKAKQFESTARIPTLVGTEKYDTYPRSRQEERKCWPCSVMQARQERIENAQRYSFDVPLSKDANTIIKKVDEIINKYGSGSTIGSSKMNEKEALICQCHKDQRKKSLELSSKSTVSKLSSDSSKNKGPAKMPCDKDIQCTIGCECKKKDSEDFLDKNVGPDDTPLENTERQCICKDADAQTDTLKCTCVEDKATPTKACQCTKDKEEQTDKKTDETESFMSSASSTLDSGTSTLSGTSTISGSVHSCICCKKKNVTAKNLYDLRKKLSDDAYPLCRPCYRQNRRCSYSYGTYTNGHVCNCYTMVKTKILDEVKKTITDLEDLDYCCCVDVDNASNSSCCQYCRKKLKKTSKNRHGIAYLVTFENGTPHIEEKKRAPLEEIKIKIPAVRKKKHKDKENNKRRKNSRNSEQEEDRANTLQEYLSKNRPDFVETAEERRKNVNSSRCQREEQTDQNKLKFLQEHQNKMEKHSKRLFSEKEMKEITRRNYRKLPEVKQRLIDSRRRLMRQADRLIADTFNRKLREKVLKGKITLPTDVKVVNL